ncbi:GNAT family N-acetyltransferase [Miniphocaeibacter massiliensis]|uniref:GNAT family N-acetyltransferase n=1 Tax=Miniphocaeibacter massiliensis TaxID=2041841 RepID=UPI000C1C1165|nr:GNAT family N-acetyltransferase [Miniphocaeibacter massiliensis]
MVEYKLEDKRIVALDGDKEIGELTFSSSLKDLIIMDHTFVDEAYRGQKIAQKMLEKGIEYVEENNIKIIPLCPFVKREFDKNPEYQKYEYKK